MSNTEILAHLDSSALIALRIIISFFVGLGALFSVLCAVVAVILSFVCAVTVAVFVGVWWMMRQVIVLVMTSQYTANAYARLGASI